VRSVPGPLLFLVSAGATIGSLVNGWAGPVVAGDDGVFNLGNIAAVFHVAYIALRADSFLAVAAVVPLVIARVMQSSFRQVALAAVLGGSLASVTGIVRASGKQRWVKGMRAMGVVGAVVWGASWYVGAFGLTATQYNRLVERVYARGDEGDVSRVERARELPMEAVTTPLPLGFQSKGYAADDPPAVVEQHGRLLDSPLYELIRTVGGPLAIVVCLWIAAAGGRAVLRSAHEVLSVGDESLVASFALYVALTFVTGAFLWHSYESVFFGAALGRWFALASKRPLAER
jgi:hypothetical protein